jgi:hypothetical protein
MRKLSSLTIQGLILCKNLCNIGANSEIHLKWSGWSLPKESLLVDLIGGPILLVLLSYPRGPHISRLVRGNLMCVPPFMATLFTFLRA